MCLYKEQWSFPKPFETLGSSVDIQTALELDASTMKENMHLP
jgi:hypothetical protein